MLVAVLTVLLFALGMFYFSFKMMLGPAKFAANLREFANWRYFHPFEISSRFIFALGFYYSQNNTDYPTLYLCISGILLFTTVFLLLIGKQRHMAFAYQIADNSAPFLRPSGVFGIVIAGFIIYSISLERLFT